MDDPNQTALIEQFTKGLDPEGAAAIAARITTAEADLAVLKAKPDLSGDLATATERADAAEKDRDFWKESAEATAKARDALQAELDDTSSAPSVSEKDAVKQPRRLAPLLEDDVLDRTALEDAIADADVVEIAFSDGKKEVRGLSSRIVAGNAWKDHPMGLMLTQPVEIFGPGVGSSGYVIAGYALLLDDKLTAYTPREPLVVAAGGHVRLENDIYF